MLVAFCLLLKIMAVSILFLTAGNILRTKTGWHESHYSLFFWIAADYFIGFLLYFFCIRTIGLFMPFSISTYISILFLFFLIILNRNKISIISKDYNRFALYIIPVFILQLTFIILFWMQSDLNNVFSIIGTLHGPRYANIALYILKNNHIPVISQNYVQSLMAATPFVFGGNMILVSLSIFLAINISFFWMLVNGLLKRFFVDKSLQFFATILVMCGGICFSTRNFLLVDSGWPWFANGYSDTIVALASFVILLLLLIRTSSRDSSINKNWMLVVAGIHVVSWFALGVENIILLGGIAVVYTCLKLYRKLFSITQFTLFLFVFLCSSIIGIVEGGMLTPHILQSRVDLPGLMALKNPDKHAISFKLGLPYYIMNKSKDSLRSPIVSTNFAYREDEGFAFSKHKVLYKSFYALGLQVLFIPFFTILLSLQWVNKIKDDTLKKIICCGILSFVFGLAIVFPFDFFGRKWELSRFLIPGYFSIGVLAAVNFFNVANKFNIKFGKPILIFMTIFFLIGPAAGVYRKIDHNFNKKDFEKDFNDFKAAYNNYIY